MIKVLKIFNEIPNWLRVVIPYNKQIKYIRERLGISQRVLAKIVGTTQSGIANIENSNVSPSVKTLERIAEKMNCTLKVLFVPNEEFETYLNRIIDQKVHEILNESISNSTLEQQPPSADVIKKLKEELREDISKNKKSLWNE